MDRRRFLTVASVGVAGTVAGCLGSGSGSGDDTTTGAMDDGGNGGMDDGGDGMTDDGGMSATTGEGQMEGEDGMGGPVPDHPATAALRDQPRLGDLGGHLIVAFEDPSCPRCARFENDTVPEIEEKIVGPGKGAFVFRNYPVIYEWGKPASQALEATYARDEAASWSLLDHYFTEQSSFSTGNVLDRTASFLDAETDLDGSAVAEDARNEAYGGAVETDLQAASDADVGRTTPTVLLFRDGEYATRASGSVSYDLIASVLGEG